jgi:hypothetical protein
MGTTGEHTDRILALSQQAPLFVSINENAPLVEDAIQKKGRSGLRPTQVSDVNPSATEVLQVDGQLGCRRRTIACERDQ